MQFPTLAISCSPVPTSGQSFKGMDYGTYFFTNIVSVTVLTLSGSLLAWHNRKVVGMQWFAAAMVVGWFKLLFQGLDGKIRTALSGMAANELYLLSFTV